MRPAIEVATQICGCAYAHQRKADTALIEADHAEVRAELVREIVAELRDMAAWNDQHDDGLSGLDKMATGQLEAADHIAHKFGGRDA